MAKSIRLFEKTYSRLLRIKLGIEVEASKQVEAKMRLSFDEVINKLCDVYLEREAS